MIIIQVVGGIGNQIFQYIFGKYLSEKFNQKVVYDIRYYNSKKSSRQCELEIIDPNLSIYECKTLFLKKYTYFSYNVWKLLFKLKPNNYIIKEDEFTLDELCLDDNKYRYFFQGYWQNVKYIDYLKSKPEFLNLKYQVEPEILSYKNSIEKEDSVCIHVRRGDYFSPTNISIYGICDSNYYNKGIKHILKKIKNPHFFVFSDDLDWVKNNIQLPENCIFINNFDINQFSYVYLMSLCKHNIISNSSFSWWGAFLNQNENKIIVCPSKWTLLSEESLALDSWIKL